MKSREITLVVVTADRRDEAAGCISGFLASGRPGRTLVFDDSRNPSETDSLSRTQATLQITRSDRKRFAERLSHEGIPEAVARFCVLGPDEHWFTAGANRNAALISSVGERILMVDDDTRSDIAIFPGHSPSVELAGHNDPTDIRFFRTREEVLAAATWSSVDILHEAVQYLGLRLDELNPTPIDSCEHLRQLRDQNRGLVGIVSFGVAGDSGFYSPVHLLWMSSRTTSERLRGSDRLLEIAMSSREVIRMARCPTITHATVCMATAFALDNEVFLPPFLPGGRNEDGFFGNLLARILPDVCTLHLPYAVLHQPPAPRAYKRLCHEVQVLRVSELLILLLSRCPLAAGIKDREALRVLGTYLTEVTASPGQFVLIAREVVRAARKALLDNLLNPSKDMPAPGPLYHTMLGQFCQNIRDLIALNDCWKPIEFFHLPEPAAQEEAWRFTRMTGELLLAWQDIRNAGAYLRTRHMPLRD